MIDVTKMEAEKWKGNQPDFAKNCRKICCIFNVSRLLAQTSNLHYNG